MTWLLFFKSVQVVQVYHQDPDPFQNPLFISHDILIGRQFGPLAISASLNFTNNIAVTVGTNTSDLQNVSGSNMVQLTMVWFLYVSS